LKVVFVHQDGRLTGSAFSLLNLIRGFKGSVAVHVVLAEVGPYQTLLAQEGIPTSICPFVRFWTFPGPNWYQKHVFLQLKAAIPNLVLRQHILDLAPDLVHLNDKACLQAGVSLRNYSIPIVQHLRSSYFPTSSPLGKWASISCIRSYANALIAISEDETDGFIQDKRLSVIFNTVNLTETEEAIAQKQATRSEFGIGENEIVIGYAANISGVKGAWDFLNMAIALCESYPEKPLRFVMAGTLPNTTSNPGRLAKWGLRKLEDPKAMLEAFKAHPLLKDKLLILGFQKAILPIIAAMDILVVCTRLGVLGRQPFEAMAVKTPIVVAAGHTGKSRVVLHEKTGLVAPMKDLPALIQATERLILDGKLRQQLAENGYVYARTNFNPAINSQKVLELYQSLLGKKTASSPAHATEV